MERNTTKNSLKNKTKFYCEKCDYSCLRSGDFKKHINSKKHKSQNTTELQQKILYECECGRTYNHRASLFNHKKKCSYVAVTEDETQQLTKLDPNMVRELIEKNTELQQQLVELSGKFDTMVVNNNITKNITKNNTNNFNINVFLNEQCRDAINFTDFVDRIEVSHDDLENNANMGFVNGISKIFVDNLKQLTLHERPIHCTDVKRETMYIKDDDQWQKEKTIIQEKIQDAIKEVSRKSLCSLLEWKEGNPEYDDLDSEFANKCVVIQKESLPGTNKEKLYPRVTHNIAKESIIEKSNE